MQYRAWGALKAGSYGNSKSLAVSYDVGMRPASYEVPGIMKKSYQYYPDGSSKFVQDQLTTNSKFDRSYAYDHAARITTALSGAEARGQGETNDRPYNETFGYDGMGHLNSRVIKQWDRYESSGTAVYVNNRRQGWQYDADGRLTYGSGGEYLFDAAGQICSFGDSDPYKTDQQTDGNGQRARSVLQSFNPETSQWTTEKVTYYVTSSVLGALVSELSATGAKEQTYVHGGGKILAVQSVVGSVQYLSWKHYDPSGSSYRATDTLGYAAEASEMDPMGADAELMKPLVWPPPSSSGRLTPYGGVPELLSASQGCEIDKMPIPCEQLQKLMDHGGVSAKETMDDGSVKSYDILPVGLSGIYRRWVPREGKKLGKAGEDSETVVTINIDADDNVGQWENFALPVSLSYARHHVPQKSTSQPQDTRSSNQKACDEKIAGIFGGPGAVAATVAEPTTLLSDNRNRNPALSYDHLAGSGVFHIYTNAQGTEATVGLYRPANGKLLRGGEYDNEGQTENYFRYGYSRGPLKGVELSFVHVGGTHGGEVGGQYLGKFPGEPLRVGNIGGPGGAGYGYNHTHVKVFYKGKLTDPRQIFCKEFGF